MPWEMKVLRSDKHAPRGGDEYERKPNYVPFNSRMYCARARFLKPTGDEFTGIDEVKQVESQQLRLFQKSAGSWC
jgi:hypothetical protein